MSYRPSRPACRILVQYSAFIILIVSSLWGQRIPLNPQIPSGFGVDIHFVSPRPGELQELADSGVRWVRSGFSWSDTERAPGRYDFSAYSRLVAALSRYHIRALFDLDYTNNLYDQGLSPHTDSGRQAFASWAAAAAKYFSGRRVIWEIYNEPNGYFWKPKRNDADYIKLALAVSEAIKESAPEAVVVGPASALIDLPFLKKCLQAGLLAYWSAVTVHPYRQRPPETAAPEYAKLRSLIREYAPPGKTIPIVAGEWGYPGTWLWPGMNNTLQANLLAREFLSDIAAGVPMTVWYGWRDDGPDLENQLDNYGLVKFQYSSGHGFPYAPKPAYRAIQTLSRVLFGYRFSRRVHVGGAADYVLLFSNGREQRLAAWTAAWQPVQVDLSGAKGRFKVVGAEGASRKPLGARNGRLRITLTDAPVYVEPQAPTGLEALE